MTVTFPFRGWGLRCLDDIPKGSFVCTYVGNILNEEMANKVRKQVPNIILGSCNLKCHHLAFSIPALNFSKQLLWNDSVFFKAVQW